MPRKIRRKNKKEGETLLCISTKKLKARKAASLFTSFFFVLFSVFNYIFPILKTRFPARHYY